MLDRILRSIKDPLGTKKLASLGYEGKMVALASFPRFCIVMWSSAFLEDHKYLLLLRHVFSYDDSHAFQLLNDIRNSGEEGAVIFTGHLEITEHRYELIRQYVREHDMPTLSYELRELP